MIKVTVTLCAQCGNMFEFKKPRRFCCRSCYHKWLSENIVEEIHHRWNGGVNKICQVCGKQFNIKKARNKDNRGKYCSKECYVEWQKNNMKGNKSPRWKGGPPKRKCDCCGKVYTSLQKSKYCSHKCWAKHNGIKHRGENNHSWKGGVTTGKNIIRHCTKYSEWRTDVFKRDNYRCRICGIRNNKLHAHHLKTFSLIIQDIKQKYPLFKIQEVADGHSELWDINNGITLCKVCHKKIHKGEIKWEPK